MINDAIFAISANLGLSLKLRMQRTCDIRSMPVHIYFSCEKRGAIYVQGGPN